MQPGNTVILQTSSSKKWKKRGFGPSISKPHPFTVGGKKVKPLIR
jgi:hypothetical protein